VTDDPRDSPDDPGRGRHRTVGADARTVTFARKLRKEMSLPEVLLWRALRGKPLGIKFRRQYPVKGFVADFACLESRLLIEIDGIAHDMGGRPQRDERRDAILKADGWRVLRIAAKRVLAEPLETAEAIVRLAQSLQEGRSSPERGGGSPQG
jgi:very-short-patch-repair endonuclease